MFNPPQRIPHYSTTEVVIYLNDYFWAGSILTQGLPTEINAVSPLTPSTFEMNKTYDVTMRTMTNTSYTATITTNKQ